MKWFTTASFAHQHPDEALQGPLNRIHLLFRRAAPAAGSAYPGFLSLTTDSMSVLTVG